MKTHIFSRRLFTYPLTLKDYDPLTLKDYDLQVFSVLTNEKMSQNKQDI